MAEEPQRERRGQEEERAEVRRGRERPIRGLADLLPDWILPPEGKDHVANARRELLLAARSILDACIEKQQRRTASRPPTRIEIE